MLAFLTDYGTADAYAAQLELKARQWLKNQATPILHLTHSVPPFNLAAGAWRLGSVAKMLPPGAVVVAVVDPGVGTQRPLVWAKLVGGAQVLATHPHLLAFCALSGQPRQADGEPFLSQASATFHGRDILTPLACQLLNQEITPADWPPADCPPPDFAQVRPTGGTLLAQVVDMDRFGNLITPITPEHTLKKTIQSLSINAHQLYNQSTTFAHGPPGEAFFYWGSQGTLEIAMDQNSAADHLGVGVGVAVSVHLAAG